MSYPPPNARACDLLRSSPSKPFIGVGGGRQNTFPTRPCSFANASRSRLMSTMAIASLGIPLERAKLAASIPIAPAPNTNTFRVCWVSPARLEACSSTDNGSASAPCSQETPGGSACTLFAGWLIFVCIVPSRCGNVFALLRKRIPSHRLYLLVLHHSQDSQGIPASIATYCPGQKSVTRGPTAVITPADSWPSTSGA